MTKKQNFQLRQAERTDQKGLKGERITRLKHGPLAYTSHESWHAHRGERLARKLTDTVHTQQAGRWHLRNACSMSKQTQKGATEQHDIQQRQRAARANRVCCSCCTRITADLGVTRWQVNNKFALGTKESEQFELKHRRGRQYTPLMQTKCMRHEACTCATHLKTRLHKKPHLALPSRDLRLCLRPSKLRGGKHQACHPSRVCSRENSREEKQHALIHTTNAEELP